MGSRPKTAQVLRRPHLDLGGRHARAAQEAPDLVPPPCHARRAARVPRPPSRRHCFDTPAPPVPDRARHPARSRELLEPGPGLAEGGRQPGCGSGGESGRRTEVGGGARGRGRGRQRRGRRWAARARGGGARAGRTLLPGAPPPGTPLPSTDRCGTSLSHTAAPSCFTTIPSYLIFRLIAL